MRSTGGRRGYRRIEWIESALAPWRSDIDDAGWRRLVCALAMVIGWEALIAQRDVCGLTTTEGVELSVWSARALVHAAFGETGQRRRGPVAPRRHHATGQSPRPKRRANTD